MAKLKYTRRGMPLKERLALRSVPGPHGCIDFIGRLNAYGYGCINISNREQLTHRASYEAHIGPIPSGLCILHSCDRPCCINPAHLRVGTPADNGRDKSLRERAKKKLTVEKVKCIRKDTRTLNQIAKEHGISESMVHYVKSRKTWKHVV